MLVRAPRRDVKARGELFGSGIADGSASVNKGASGKEVTLQENARAKFQRGQRADQKRSSGVPTWSEVFER